MWLVVSLKTDKETHVHKASVYQLWLKIFEKAATTS